MLCPCCSDKLYEKCCKPYHVGQKMPVSAEILMRARYSAFAIPNGNYLYITTHPLKRQFHPLMDYQTWAQINKWERLEILSKPSPTQVEFKAYYTDPSGQKCMHHELSFFTKENNHWFYLNGEILN